MQALLRAKANTELLDNDGHTALQWAEHEGHTLTAKLIRQHATLPLPTATTSPAATPDAGKPVEGAPAPLPKEILRSAERGELQKVVKWLRILYRTVHTAPLFPKYGFLCARGQG